MSWIKVRINLASDPKVVRISSGLVRKLSGSCPDFVRVVSATVGAIVRTWAMADQFASEGVLKGMTCEALDQHVGLDGFAQEMIEVGWLMENEGSLQLPNYEEHNGTTGKTRAMDQARKNSVRKLSGSCPDSVRVQTGQNPDRTRTKRESKNKNSNPNGLLPLTPTKKSAKFDPVADIEAPFASKEWAEAWAKWCAHRSELRKPLTRQATESQIAELARMGEERALAAIHHSLRGGWQGIFEPKAEKPEGFGAGYGVRPSATERAAQTAERLISGKSAIANQIFAELQAMEMGQ